jgi:Carboxypeptidase regulatory-like domain
MRIVFGIVIVVLLAVLLGRMSLDIGSFPIPSDLGSGDASNRRRPDLAPERGPNNVDRPVREVGDSICRLFVEGPSGTPMPGCVARVWQMGGSEVHQGTTGVDGCVTLPGLSGFGGWLLEPPELPVLFADCPQLNGDHVIRLELGDVVGGTLIVDSSPAQADLEVVLRTTHSVAWELAPPSITERLKALSVRSTRTNAHGRFSFPAVAPGWRGLLDLPPMHWLLPPEASHEWPPTALPLDSARDDLEIQATALPTVIGVIRWYDSGEPVPMVPVWVRAVCAGDFEVGASGLTDGLGRFHLGLGAPQLYSSQWIQPGKRPAMTTLEIGHHFAWAVPVSMTLAGNAIRDPIELRLERVPLVSFRVTDSKGNPIRGARAGRHPLSEPTNGDGRGVFPGRPSIIGAPGHAVVPAAVRGGAGTPTNPYCYELPPVNWVKVAVRSPSDRSSEGLRIRLEGKVNLSAGRASRSSLHGFFGGAPIQEGGGNVVAATGGSEEFSYLETEVGEGGGAAFHSLEPGVACNASLRDAIGKVLAKADLVTPAFGDSKEVMLEFMGTSRSVAGRITDERGQAITGAIVRLSTEPGPGCRTMRLTSDENGRFRFAGLHDDGPIDLLVRAHGRVPQELRGLMRDQDGVAHEFRLLPGHSVTVRVIDDAGQAVDLAAVPEGFGFQDVEKLGPGLWRWLDLPHAVVFVATLQGSSFRCDYDGILPEAVLIVPKLARVVAPLASFPNRPGWDPTRCFLAAQRIDGTGSLEYLPFQDDSAQPRLLLPGGYSVTLVERQFGVDGRPVFRPLGMSKVVELLADQVASLVLP